MRNNIIIISLIVILVSTCVFFEIYISKLTNEFEAKIEACHTSDEIRAVTDEWNERSRILELMINHEEITPLIENLWAMQVEIDIDSDDFERLKKLAIESLKHIFEKNRLSIDNIF